MSTTTELTNELSHVYVSIDIETISPDYSVPIAAVGLVVGDEKGNVLDRRAFCHKYNEAQMDSETKKFWDQFPYVLERIRAEAVADPMAELHTYLVNLEKKYGPFGRKHKDRVEFKWLCDNPGFDISRINSEFKDRGWRPLAEMFDDYVSTDDPSEQMRGLTPMQKNRVDSYVKTPHTHWPVDDAEETYEQYIGIEKTLQATTYAKLFDGSEKVTLAEK